MKKEENAPISLILPTGLISLIKKEAAKEDRKYTAFIRKILKDKFNYK